jgi:hypothetical protein
MRMVLAPSSVAIAKNLNVHLCKAVIFGPPYRRVDVVRGSRGADTLPIMHSVQMTDGARVSGPMPVI